MIPQAVVYDYIGLIPADAVKVQVHDAEPGRAVHDLPAVKGAVSQMGQLALVHARMTAHDVVVGRQQEPAGAAGGVADGGVRLRAHDVDDGLDQGTRREVLPRSRLHVLGVALQQRLVGVAFDVSAEGQPVLAVDQVLDEPGEHGRLLYPVLGLAENDAEGVGLAGKGFQGTAIVGLQLVAVPREQAGPVAAVGNGRRLIAGQEREGRLAALVHHLEEDEVGELLQVVAVGETGISQHIAVVPELLADAGGCGHGVSSWKTSCFSGLDRALRRPDLL